MYKTIITNIFNFVNKEKKLGEIDFASFKKGKNLKKIQKNNN